MPNCEFGIVVYLCVSVADHFVRTAVVDTAALVCLRFGPIRILVKCLGVLGKGVVWGGGVFSRVVLAIAFAFPFFASPLPEASGAVFPLPFPFALSPLPLPLPFPSFGRRCGNFFQSASCSTEAWSTSLGQSHPWQRASFAPILMMGLLPSVIAHLQGRSLLAGNPPGHGHDPLPDIPTLAWCSDSSCCAAAKRVALTGANRWAARTVLRALARFDLSLRCQLGDELRKVIVSVRPHRTRNN